MITPLRSFNVLIAEADGRRMRRLDLPGWALIAGGVSVFAIVGILAALCTTYYHAYHATRTQYLALVEQSREIVTLRQRTDEQQLALRQRTDEQQRFVESIRRRVRDIQSEVGGWRPLHERIVASIGPEMGGVKRMGVGGPSRPVETPDGIVGDLDRLLVSVSEEGQRLHTLEGLTARAAKLIAAIPSRWPVRGHINSGFGRRISPWGSNVEFHSGLDIAAGSGTPVTAPGAGTVVFAGRGGDYGNEVIIDHGHDLSTRFGHLQRVEVTVGQQVRRGQQIALSGNTGRSTGPHLHYEVLVKKQSVDPRSYLRD